MKCLYLKRTQKTNKLNVWTEILGETQNKPTEIKSKDTLKL